MSICHKFLYLPNRKNIQLYNVIKRKAMKRISLLIILVICHHFINAQYTTPGTGVNWKLDSLVAHSGGVVLYTGGIYTINQDLTISTGDLLTIDTDNIIKISAAKLITIKGTLIANPINGVLLTAIDTTQNFKGFRFEGSNNSYIHKCQIEFGGGIKLVNANVTFDSCRIQKNNQLNSTGAVDIFQSNPIIYHCEFYKNLGPAIASAANAASSPIIKYCHIWSNNTANSNAPQINLGTSYNSDTIIISDNNIEGLYNNAGGITISNLVSGSSISKIQNNTITNNRYGIAIIGSAMQSFIYNNAIANNNIQGNPNLGGSGINFNGGNTNISIVSRNLIIGNLWGITIQGTALPNLGQLSKDSTNLGLNYIYNNANNGTTYALYNNTPNNIFAENNYWGSTNISTVETYIFHQPDNPSLGLVDYIPIFDSSSVQIDNHQLLNNRSLEVNIFPNPFKTEINIKFLYSWNTQEEPIKIKLFNSNGTMVASYLINEPPSDIKLPIKGLTQGVYYLMISNRDYTYCKTIVHID